MAEADTEPARDLLRSAIDSLPVLISYVGADERYRFVNRAYCEWFGRPAPDFVGRTMTEVLGPAAYASLRKWIAAVLDGKAVRFQTLANYQDAGSRDIDATYVPDFNHHNEVIGFFVLVQDVTKQRQVEVALKISEAHLAAVLDSVADGFHAVDHQWRVTLFNAANERFFGLSRNEVLGRPLFDVFPGLEDSTFGPMLKEAMSGNYPFPVEAPSITSPDRRVLARATPLPEGGITISFSDVTDRWLAEQAQQASELRAREQLEELEAIYESSPVGLAFLTRDMRYVRVNRRLAEMNGVPAHAHIGLTVREVVPAIADQAEAIRDRLEAGEELVSYEIAGETPAEPGVERAWLEYWTPLRGELGEVRGLNVVVEEITERKRVENRTRLLVDELNHRVKNTLSVVQNLARQSFRGEPSATAAREAFEQRLVTLAAAHNILTQRHWEAADLGEVIRASVGDAIERINVSGPTLTVTADLAVALSLALHELTTNARKHGALSNERGQVRLDWARAEHGGATLRWSEIGGPIVVQPTRRGFGSRLLQRALDGVPGGGTELKFEPSGVVCELNFQTAATQTCAR